MTRASNEKPHRRLLLWQKAVLFVADVYRAARRTRKEYLQFLYVARGSVSEIDTQLEVARQLGYLTQKDASALQAQLDELSRMLNGMMGYLSRAGEV